MDQPTAMPFRIRLETSGAPLQRNDNDEHSYDEELDDVNSVIQDACVMLSQSPDVRFVVEGFADDPWPVDVETDLAVMLGQLPKALSALRHNSEATLEFYEQGIERALEMGGTGSEVEIRCTSWHATWKPQPPIVTVQRDQLVSALAQLGIEFFDLIKQVSPDLSSQAWLKEWRVSLEQA